MESSKVLARPCKSLNISRRFQQHFTYEFFVRTSFFYVHVTREMLPKQCFVRKIRTYNVDEIDGWFHNIESCYIKKVSLALKVVIPLSS